MLSSVLTGAPHTSALQVCLAEASNWPCSCLSCQVSGRLSRIEFELTHSDSIVGMGAFPFCFTPLCLFGLFI